MNNPIVETASGDTREKPTPSPWWVVKVGGSLLRRPNLGVALQAWIERQPTRHLLLIPGGGEGVDVIRRLDKCHQLGDELAHGLALSALSLTARVLAALLPCAIVMEEVTESGRAWEANQIPILDVMRFLKQDERCSARLPHSWAVTSDSIAARVAVVHQAAKLVLLKSCPIPQNQSMAELAAHGIVDEHFPVLAQRLPQVELVTLPA